MASGDPVVQIIRECPLAATAAFPNVIVGTSSPAERIPVWEFADAGIRYLDLLCVLRGYAGGGLTFALKHGAAATGNGRISLAIRAIPDDTEDLDTTAHTYDYNASTIAAPSAVGEVAYDDMTFTSGADMDSLANGELFILRIRREPADAADTIANSWYLYALDGRET
jgi:hypothetical protein